MFKGEDVIQQIKHTNNKIKLAQEKLLEFITKIKNNDDEISHLYNEDEIDSFLEKAIKIMEDDYKNILQEKIILED